MTLESPKETNQLKNFIWDFDGTLFNTYPTMLVALKQAMALHHISYAGDLFYYIKKYSIKQFSKEYANQAFLDDYHNIEHQMQLQNLPQVYEGIPEILQGIVAAGGQNFVLSHRDQTTFDYLGDKQALFTEIITSKQAFARKPSPEAINYLIDKYDLKRSETAMVGDRPLDVLAGKNAGVYTILLDEQAIFGDIADRKIKNWS